MLSPINKYLMTIYVIVIITMSVILHYNINITFCYSINKMYESIFPMLYFVIHGVSCNPLTMHPQVGIGSTGPYEPGKEKSRRNNSL